METYMQILGRFLSTNFIQSWEWPESIVLERQAAWEFRFETALSNSFPNST